jgi:hypothetical protein
MMIDQCDKKRYKNQHCREVTGHDHHSNKKSGKQSISCMLLFLPEMEAKNKSKASERTGNM